ncbi:MAG: hypothetical protein ACRCX2_10160 [Paraclostridium sp.]
MTNSIWTIVQSFFIFPVLGGMCATTLFMAKKYNSLFHLLLGLSGIVTTVILLLRLSNII